MRPALRACRARKASRAICAASIATSLLGTGPGASGARERPSNTGPAAFHTATDGVGTQQSDSVTLGEGSDSSEKWTVRPVRTARLSGKKSDFGLS